MKAATGELSLTLITVIAVGAILAFFWVLWPNIKEKINGTMDNWQESETTGYVVDNAEYAYADYFYNNLV